ncbi:MAG TPA: helix-turn-helix domain-containing protein [Candidatus Paceibacterota bacterium]|nr:helix-turn-helix domain-containing protein [Candidatus Paceibacterota bacterium]
MDEILIEEKKYVSSKQAAKITGYAKDYIGQLCREGRVPARLVGRSWYVLESAIHDHRFGDQKTDQEEIMAARRAQTFSPAWESPRYESSSSETIPSVNRLRNVAEEELAIETPHNFQDSWKAWFDRVAEAAPPASEIIPERNEAEREEEAEKEPEAEPEGVRVPIRAVYRQPPEELLPRRHLISSLKDEEPVQEKRKSRRKLPVFIQFAGMLIAVVAVCLAVLGSGYFDEYALSQSSLSAIAGVSAYNR